jgi:hypothetical protein
MGCCTVQALLLPNHSRYLSQIEPESNFSISSSCPSPKNINDPVSIINNLTLNPLGMALWQGNAKEFQSLIQEKGALVEQMEKLLEKQSKSGIELIIERGHESLFKFYLPIFLLDPESSELLQKPLIHKVVQCGQLGMLKFIRCYFYHVKPPNAFSFHYIEPKTGENPALVACRGLNLEVIKYLYSLGCDFSLRNFKRHTALQIAVISMESKEFSFEIFVHLVEKCNVDVVTNWQSILFALEDSSLSEYYRKQLEKFGVKIEKDEMYKKFNEKFEDKNREEDNVELNSMSSISVIDFDEFSVSALEESRRGV